MNARTEGMGMKEVRSRYENGRISFDLLDLLDKVPAEQKREMVESLSCDDDVIAFVSQQIIDRWTDGGCHGAISCTANSEAYRGLDKAWRDVAKASGDVARREIERLEKALSESEKRYCALVAEMEDRRTRYGA